MSENLMLTDVNGFSSPLTLYLPVDQLNNVIRNQDNSSQPGRIAFIDGADGDDTLIGGTGQDHFIFAAGSGSYGTDSVDGGDYLDDLSWASIAGQSWTSALAPWSAAPEAREACTSQISKRPSVERSMIVS